MPHRIDLTPDGNFVRLTPPDDSRGPKRDRIEIEKINVTDKQIGLLPGTMVERADVGYKVVKLSPAVPLIGGTAPDIDRNPYNFVDFAGAESWRDAAGAAGRHAGHQCWMPELHTGRISFHLTAHTPLFVPAGFTSDSSDRTPRKFCTMQRSGEAGRRYAVPGASLKGVLRSAVEALANDRFGAASEDIYKMPLPYRRRSFKVGIVEAPLKGGHFRVRRIELDYLNLNDIGWRHLAGDPAKLVSYDLDARQQHKNVAVPGARFHPSPTDIAEFRPDLLCSPSSKHRWTHVVIRRQTDVFFLDKAVVKHYQAAVDHPHYERHHKDSTTYLKLSGWSQVKAQLADIKSGEIIYFTADDRGAVKMITSFGKNVNYLWPAKYSLGKLTHNFHPLPLSLGDPLGLAERMFGFASDHAGEHSHPFRGKVQIETLWGPMVGDNHTLTLKLAALTGPPTRAKSRPLYLKPGAGGRSASYSDPTPAARGRKFYWHQRVNDNPAEAPNGLWRIHQADVPNRLHIPEKHANQQLPPPIEALPAGSEFTGTIQFENLSGPELGALLYALRGDGEAQYAFHIGKGKPRGLGSMKCERVGIELFQPAEYYASLDAPPYTAAQPDTYVQSFKAWCQAKAKDDVPFEKQSHVRQYVCLHSWPGQPCIRMYPINFADYGWLPKPNVDPDEPAGQRPRAMKPACESADRADAGGNR